MFLFRRLISYLFYVLPWLYSGVFFCGCVQKMGTEGRLRPLEKPLNTTMIARVPPLGTVAQTPDAPDKTYSPQREVKNSDSRMDRNHGTGGEHKRVTDRSIIPPPTQNLYSRLTLQKGQELYRVYCMPCHGMSGYGNGMIVQRGFLAPPSYHIDRLRNAPDTHFFDVISKGYGAMYSYSDRVSASESRSIISYIRALQFSQNAHLKDLKDEDRQKLVNLPRSKR